MDKHIDLLNILKKRLNKLLTREQNYKEKQKLQNQFTNVSNVRALILSENIQFGIAINEKILETSNIYSELSENGGLNFHIYPLIINVNEEMTEALDKEKEIKEQKTIYAPIQK